MAGLLENRTTAIPMALSYQPLYFLKLRFPAVLGCYLAQNSEEGLVNHISEQGVAEG